MGETLDRLARTGVLPTLPHAASAALAMIRTTDPDVGKLAAVIRTDIGLTACVLRLANSVVYARRAPATTVQAAILTVGMRKTCDIIVAASARRLCGAAGEHAEVLWSHALAVGIAAEELAKVRGAGDPESVFLPGLLHDVGRIAFFLADPVAFGEVERACLRRRRDRTALETKRYGCDHTEVGSALAAEWGLTPAHCEAIRWHHQARPDEPTHRLAVLINAADAVAHGIEETDDAHVAADAEVQALGLSAGDQAAWIGRVRESFAVQHAAFA